LPDWARGAERDAGGPALRHAQGALSPSKGASDAPGGVHPSTVARGALSNVEGQGPRHSRTKARTSR
jgi:hypothetical protein